MSEDMEPTQQNNKVRKVIIFIIVLIVAIVVAVNMARLMRGVDVVNPASSESSMTDTSTSEVSDEVLRQTFLSSCSSQADGADDFCECVLEDGTGKYGLDAMTGGENAPTQAQKDELSQGCAHRVGG